MLADNKKGNNGGYYERIRTIYEHHLDERI